MIPFPQISPEIFTINLFGIELALRWYALAYLVGLLIGWRIMVMLMRRPALWGDAAPMRPEQVEELLTWVILGVVVGGRLGFVLFYEPGYYLANPSQIPVIWRGGMSFHGGFLGVVLASWWFCRRNGIPALRLADALAVVAPVGLFFGRIANFINAELWGRPTAMPWGVAFPGEAAQSCATATLPCIRHPSQLYEAGLEGLVLGLILLVVAFGLGGLRRPGLVAGLFLAGYGLSRFVVEFFRQPDAQFVTDTNPLGLAIHFGGWGVTMGQILSLPMIVLGLWLVARARARQA